MPTVYKRRTAVYCVCPECHWFAEENFASAGTQSHAVHKLAERMNAHLDSRCKTKFLQMEVREYYEVPPDEGLEPGAMREHGDQQRALYPTEGRRPKPLGRRDVFIANAHKSTRTVV